MSSLLNHSKALLDRAKRAGKMIALAESCTGGLIAKSITDHPGSSAIFDRGFVTYSNVAKMDLLGVEEDVINKRGAVSRPVARAMVIGALDHSMADIAASVTGIAGPGGGSPEKPVGLVYIGIATRGQDPIIHKLNLDGDRDTIRKMTAVTVCQKLIKII